MYMILKTFIAGNLLLLLNLCLSDTAFSTKFSSQRDSVPSYFPALANDEVVLEHKGYSLCYSEEYEQAKWVMYRLTAEMCSCKGEERSNDFRADAAVATGSASPSDYLRSGFDRGHLCPAGDMTWDETAMSESFLMSNMSPQLPGFNRGIWKRLESKVREWAIADKEIYVVCGGVLKAGLPVIGTNKVAVPELYYKIILDHHAPDYKAIAFVMPNQSSQASLFQYAVSIDSVESLTGIDFFPALLDEEENMLEASCESESWSAPYFGKD
jgi:endonuclease G